MMNEMLEFKKLMNIPFAVIVASFIIIIITTNMTDKNSVSALLGGYSGVFIGMLFTVVLHLTFFQSSYLDMFPMAMVMIIVGLSIFYLGANFDRISKGEVSSYYSSFSTLSIIFLITQSSLIFTAIYKKTQQPQSIKMFSDTTFSLLGLFSVINLLIVVTIGIVLHFYSTQG
jgi:hypothetical protein